MYGPQATKKIKIPATVTRASQPLPQALQQQGFSFDSRRGLVGGNRDPRTGLGLVDGASSEESDHAFAPRRSRIAPQSEITVVGCVELLVDRNEEDDYGMCEGNR